MKKLFLLAIVFASISGVGFLSHNVFSIDLQSFQLFGSIDEFTTPVCTCAGDDGQFTMANCQQFMGDYSDPNMLCVWEAGVGEYGDPPSSAQGCGVGFWKNNAKTSELSVIESESNTVWPPGYQPDYYFNEMFHTTILAQLENVIDEENEIHRNDVILEEDTDEEKTSKNDKKKKESKENEIHRNDVILEEDPFKVSNDDEDETSEDEEENDKSKDGKKGKKKPGDESDSELTLLDALNAKGGKMNALLRHSVAALLNAAHSDVNYPHSVVEVISLTQIALITEDYKETANMFEEFNDDSEKPLLCSDG